MANGGSVADIICEYEATRASSIDFPPEGAARKSGDFAPGVGSVREREAVKRYLESLESATNRGNWANKATQLFRQSVGILLPHDLLTWLSFRNSLVYFFGGG